jgi:hypothetical protein
MNANNIKLKSVLISSVLAAAAYAGGVNADTVGRYTCYGYAGSTAGIGDTATQALVIGLTHNNPNTKPQTISRILVRNAAGTATNHAVNYIVPKRGAVQPFEAIVTGAVPGIYSVQVFWSQASDVRPPVPMASNGLYDGAGVFKGATVLPCVNF